jgi:hypothetical protein
MPPAIGGTCGRSSCASSRAFTAAAGRAGGAGFAGATATGESKAAALMTPRPGGEGRSSSCAGSGGGSSAAAAAGDAAGGFFLRGTPLGHPMTCRRELFRGGYSLVRSACRAMRAIC